jgi:hypothetical protein
MNSRVLFLLEMVLFFCFYVIIPAWADKEDYYQKNLADCLNGSNMDPSVLSWKPVKDKICYCMNDWAKKNNINEATATASQSAIDKALKVCFQSAIWKK